MWEAVTLVEGIPRLGSYDTCRLTGLWSTQAEAEGIEPKAAWHRGRDSSVANDLHSAESMRTKKQPPKQVTNEPVN